MKLIVLIMCLIAIKDLHAQELNVGDKIPARKIKIDNYTSDVINFSDLKGKFIILDFWDHGCISCLESFPKMDSLQKHFADRLQIVLVNNESRDSTKKFLSRRKKLITPNLPRISGDILLSEMFPHHFVPYQIWIDTLGVIRFKASGAMANVENINAFFTGTLKGDAYVQDEPWINSLFDSSYIASLEHYSYLSRYIPRIRLVNSARKGFIQRTYNCVSVVELYKRAYSNSYYGLDTVFSRPGKVILELADSIKYLRPKNGIGLTRWLENYSYNYQVSIPESKSGDLFKIMRTDLDRYFGLVANWEKRDVSSLVLVRISDVDKIRSKGSAPTRNFTWTDPRTPRFDSVRGFQNQDFGTFKKEFRNYIEFVSKKPFVDATGYKDKIDIYFSGSTLDSLDLSLIKNELRKYDLDLIEINWPMDVLVIRTP